MLKKIIKKVLPKKVLLLIRNIKIRVELIGIFYYDYSRYKKYSSTINNSTNYENLLALINIRYHSIEKGLSYKNIRLGFGKDVIRELLELLDIYCLKGYTINNNIYISAITSLKEYIEIHEKHNCDVSELRNKVYKYSIDEESRKGGVYNLTKGKILESSKSDFKTFSQNRYSVRTFSTDEVNVDIIYEAIKIAQKTPSACNRQSSKVYVVKDEESKKILRMNQNGNRGFGDLVDKFLIITSDIRAFRDTRERNQTFVDGGMFSMSLLYALHDYGIATCSLSASLRKKQEYEIRKMANIHDSEDIVLIIALGNYEDEFKVPKSARKEVDEIVKVI